MCKTNQFEDGDSMNIKLRIWFLLSDNIVWHFVINPK